MLAIVSATERELIVAHAERATRSFYEDHRAAVRSFCASLCPAERVEEAMEATFLDFVARAGAASPDADLGDLLRCATREVAASRMDPAVQSGSDSVSPACRAMPELLAARANGELPAEYEPLTKHLRECPICQGNERRLESAEAAFAAPPQHEPVEASQLAAPPVAGSDRGPQPAPTSTAAPVGVRARRGGLVGAVRRLADR